MVFVYVKSDHLLFSDRLLAREELYTQFRSEEAAKLFQTKRFPSFEIRWAGANVPKKKRKRVHPPATPEKRRRCSVAVRGSKHNRWGKTDPIRNKKTSATMKGTRKGNRNPLFGKKHTPSTRAKMAASHRGLRKAINLQGKSIRRRLDQPLPPGYFWATHYRTPVGLADHQAHPLPE
jgi:hypothetical protein